MKIPAPRCRFSVLLAAMLLARAVPASAIDGAADKVKDGEPEAAPAEKITSKFTPSYYHTTNVTPAYDLNLRGNLGAQTAWIGFYQRSNEFQQLRLGYENTLELPFGRVTPSMQYATRGFLGGSLTGEIGERYFALAGFDAPISTITSISISIRTTWCCWASARARCRIRRSRCSRSATIVLAPASASRTSLGATSWMKRTAGRWTCSTRKAARMRTRRAHGCTAPA